MERFWDNHLFSVRYHIVLDRCPHPDVNEATDIEGHGVTPRSVGVIAEGGFGLNSSGGCPRILESSDDRLGVLIGVFVPSDDHVEARGKPGVAAGF